MSQRKWVQLEISQFYNHVRYTCTASGGTASLYKLLWGYLKCFLGFNPHTHKCFYTSYFKKSIGHQKLQCVFNISFSQECPVNFTTLAPPITMSWFFFTGCYCTASTGTAWRRKVRTIPRAQTNRGPQKILEHRIFWGGGAWCEIFSWAQFPYGCPQTAFTGHTL